jgi:hypothetical protein
MYVCEAFTQQRLLYIYLSRGRFPATGQHATLLLTWKAIISLNSINQLPFQREMQCVSCKVRTEILKMNIRLKRIKCDGYV